MHRILLLTLTTLLALSGLGAQGTPSVVSGSRVRLWAVEPHISKVAGTIIAITPESLTFRPSDFPVTMSTRQATDGLFRLSTQRVTRLDVSAGHRSRGSGAARGARWGALAGLGAALVAAAISTGSCSGETCGIEWFLFPPAGVAAGLAVGAVAGVAVPDERWLRVPLATLGR